MIGLSLLHAKVIVILALGSVTAVAFFDDGFGTIDSVIVSEKLKTEDLGDAAAKSGSFASKVGRKRVPGEGFTGVPPSSSWAEDVIREATHECSSFYNSITPFPISFRDRPTILGRLVLHRLSTDGRRCSRATGVGLKAIDIHYDETVKIGGTGPCYYAGKFTKSDGRFKFGLIACYYGDRYFAGGARCDIPGSCTHGDHGWYRVSGTEEGPCSEFNGPEWQS